MSILIINALIDTKKTLEAAIEAQRNRIELKNQEIMKKKEMLKNYRADRIDDQTVFIKNSHFLFSFTKADSVVKDEFKDQYKYFGGLQCNFKEGSEDYKNLEKWLIEIAEFILK